MTHLVDSLAQLAPEDCYLAQGRTAQWLDRTHWDHSRQWDRQCLAENWDRRETIPVPVQVEAAVVAEMADGAI